MPGFDDSLDFKFVNPDELADTGPDVEQGRKEALLNEALNAAVNAWLAEKAVATEERKANAISVPDFDGEDPDDDPHAELRAKKERMLMAIEGQKATADAMRKSFERKRARVRDLGLTLTAADIKKAKKAFLVGAADPNGNGQAQSGYLHRLETEFVQNNNRRKRAEAALAMTGDLALNEQEKAEMENIVHSSEENLEAIREVITTYRAELLDVGGTLPTAPPAKAAGTTKKAAPVVEPPTP